MVREVKSKIQDTDRFIIQREDDELKTVDGSDLAEFVEDLQSRFTDEIEESVTNVEALVTNNAQTIGANQVANEEEHDQLRADISLNDQAISANRARNAVQDSQLDSLERNSRSFGYYAFGADNAVDASGLKPGYFTAYDVADNHLTDTFVGVKKVAFHKQDGFGDVRSFMAVYSGDVIETVFVVDEEIKARATFRILMKQDVDIALQSQSGSVITINVELVDSYIEDNFTLVFNDLADIQTSYVKCANYPSQSIDDSISRSVLNDALLPIGSIIMWPTYTTSKIPEGWLICDGSSISSLESNNKYNAADFAKLKTLISSLPDLRGRVPVGTLYNNSGSSMNLSSNEKKSRYDIKSHSAYNQTMRLEANWFATNNSGGHNHNANVANAGAHTHKVGDTSQGAGGSQIKAHAVKLNNTNSTNTNSAGDHSHNVNVGNAGSHNHSINISNSNYISNEIRPAGYGIVFIIKYKNIG